MVTRRRVRGACLTLGLGVLAFGACELDETVAAGGEPMVVVSAIMRPDLPGQHVIVERTFTGGVDVPDSGDIPIPPRAPRIPIEFALVTVTNLDLPGDTCGQPVEFSATPYDTETVAMPGIYWSSPGCPTMRPGDRLRLRVETQEGELVTGTTRVPGMREAYLAVGGDSVVLGGGDSVLSFNRDRDTLRFGVDAIVGRLLQLDVRRHGYLSDYGTKVHVDTTRFTLAGDAVNAFVSGRGNDVFLGGRSYVLTLALSDTNYFNFSRSWNNPFTGRGFINRLEGGIGVFGSAVAATSRVWVVADMDDPREGLFRVAGAITAIVDGDTMGVDIDADLRVYLHRPGATGEVSAFLEGQWFRPGPGTFGAPPWVPRSVAGKSVDGTVLGQRLRFAISDTLPASSVWYAIIDGVFTEGDSISLVVAESTLVGAYPVGSVVAVRQPTP